MMLIYAIFTKVKNPDRSFIDCMPFMEEFSSKNTPKVSDSNTVKAAEKTYVQNVAVTKPTSNNVTDPDANPEIKSNNKISSKTSGKATSSPKKVKSKTVKTKTKKSKASIKGDNIKKVNGIGPVFEKKLNSIGINSFEQIASWTNADVERIDNELELSGRPQREEWVSKAKILAAAKNS